VTILFINLNGLPRSLNLQIAIIVNRGPTRAATDRTRRAKFRRSLGFSSSVKTALISKTCSNECVPILFPRLAFSVCRLIQVRVRKQLRHLQCPSRDFLRHFRSLVRHRTNTSVAPSSSCCRPFRRSTTVITAPSAPSSSMRQGKLNLGAWYQVRSSLGAWYQVRSSLGAGFSKRSSMESGSQ
jgi:hypothetical protein